MASRLTPPSSQPAEDVHPVCSAPPSSGKRPAKVKDSDWESIDAEIKRMLSPVSDLLNSNSISTTEAATSFTSIVHEHFHTLGFIKKCFYKNCAKKTTQESQLIKLTKKLSVAKNNARKNIHTATKSFLDSVRMHNKISKLARQSNQSTSTRRQEKAFLQNPWKFSKSACSDDNANVAPSFSSAEAWSHFSNSFSSSHCTYQSLPSWVYECMPSPTLSEDFDDSPVTPSAVKAILKKCSSSSSPGVDGISYALLPSCHLFLATLFSKILLETNEAPPVWCSGKITLIHKKAIPGNFRPIALTSVVGKLLHKFIAARMERFCIANDIIDTSIQKGFLRGINGTMEHIFSISSIVEHAKSNGMPLSISFLDLKNAFGSVAHNLIADVLDHVKIPITIRRYVASAYSQLNAFVNTKVWSTKSFPISRGVFQGDTMSPIIFLLSFNPIIQLAKNLQCPGFFFKIPIADTENLPNPGSTIYVEWNETSSNEAPGWYKCVVSSYNSEGYAQLSYSSDQSEVLDLRSISWMFARKSAKRYRPLSSVPPSFVPSGNNTSNQCCTSSEHKVKGFADDLTIITSSFSDHQQALV